MEETKDSSDPTQDFIKKYAGLGVDKLHAKYKKEYPDDKISFSKFKEKYRAREFNKQTYRMPKPKNYLPIFNKNNSGYQADVTYMDEAGNGGPYHYLLTIINNDSRKAYAYALKTKNAGEVLSKIEEFMRQAENDSGRKVLSMTCDLGTEFNNEQIKSYFENNGVELYFANAEDKNKMGKIERFHRTLKTIMRGQMAENDLSWPEALSGAMNLYNESPHRGLIDKHSPNEYNQADYESQYKNYKQKYKELVDDNPNNNHPEGTSVKIRLRKGLYDKGSFEPTMSAENYTTGKKYPSGTYELFNSQGQAISDNAGIKRFKPYDIKPNGETVGHNNFFEKLFKQRKQKKIKVQLKKEGVNPNNILANKRIRIKRKL